MDKLSIFKSIISGSRMILVSATASLFGTASYGVTASYAINASGLWSSSSFTASAQSIAAFNSSGRPIFLTPSENNTYIAIQNGVISWVPISDTGVGTFAVYADLFSNNVFSIIQAPLNFAIPSSSFSSDEDLMTVQLTANFAIPSSSFSSDEDLMTVQLPSNFIVPSSSFSSDIIYADSNYLNITGSTAPSSDYTSSFEILETYLITSNNMSSSMIANTAFDVMEYIETVMPYPSSYLPQFVAPSYTTSST
jgi:hypothetical protein